MKKDRKRAMPLLALMIVLAVSAGLTGCQFQKSSRKPKVAVIVKSTQSSFWKSVQAGASAASTEYNIQMSFEGPDSEEDYESQNQMVKKAIEEDVDAIVFSAVDYNANSQVIQEAAQKGIQIVVIDSDVNTDQVRCRIGTDNFQAGYMAGEAALQAEEEELYIGIVNYDVHSANGQEREAGFRERISQDDRVKAVETINVRSTTEDAREKTKELLKSRPEINVIATFNEWTSLGVGWAIRDLECKDSTWVTAFDSNAVSVGMLETGEVDSLIVQNPYAMGYLGVETAFQLINGTRKIEDSIGTDTILVNRDNMFAEECQKMLFPFNQ